MFGAPLLACHHCGTLHERVPLEPGAVANCVRCESVLYRQSRLQLNGWIALVLCALIVFAIANYFPIATLSIQGITVQASLPGALFLTWQQGREVLAIMTGLFGFWLPLTQLLFVLWALLAIRSGRLPPDFRYAMRLLRLIMPWSMVPVLMLGILVAIVKFASLASIEAGMAIWAFGVLTLLLTGLSRLTAHRLWHYAEDAGLVVTAATGAARHGVVASCGACGLVQGLDNKHALAHCARCGAGVHCRKPHQNARVWALVVSACIL